eukprot:TRINITY_DN4_c0_g1_i1.p1 TRINITY_DN4_c0_g1~~TRINITY_DN4_c0_g1_i1.p1  ORF type:complete len:166 (+),score=51.99 TRINITY_DN4_c0_g1_i1:75-572(+)
MPRRGVTVRDVPAADFISAYSKYLKKSGNVELPKWVDIVKTGIHKTMPPESPDWFYVRAAALARKIYLNTGDGRGINAYKRVFGGKQRRGSKPPKVVTASGAVIRAAVKQLTKLKVVELDPKGGRKITSTGQRDLDRIAAQIRRTMKKPINATPKSEPAPTTSTA